MWAHYFTQHAVCVHFFYNGRECTCWFLTIAHQQILPPRVELLASPLLAVYYSCLTKNTFAVSILHKASYKSPQMCSFINTNVRELFHIEELFPVWWNDSRAAESWQHSSQPDYLTFRTLLTRLKHSFTSLTRIHPLLKITLYHYTVVVCPWWGTGLECKR